MVLAATRIPEPLVGMPVSTASTVKTAGWRGITKALGAEGKLLITNHNEPQAVILTTAEYLRLLDASNASKISDPVEELRRRFDERLSVLRAADAGDKLRAIMRSPGELGGKVKAGSTY